MTAHADHLPDDHDVDEHEADDVIEMPDPARPRPTNLRLDDQLCFALYAATNTITRAYRPLLDKIGLTYPQYLVMLVLWEDDGRPTRDIARRLELPGNAISPLIDRLVTAGLVTRDHDTHDRRVVRVHLTTAGRQLEYAAADVQHTVACNTHLSPAALAELRDSARQLSQQATIATAVTGPAPITSR